MKKEDKRVRKNTKHAMKKVSVVIVYINQTSIVDNNDFGSSSSSSVFESNSKLRSSSREIFELRDHIGKD